MRRLDSTSSATWRSATSRSAERFSTLKKLLSAVGTRSGGIDLALAQALDQRLGREVDEHDLVGRGEHAVGEGLAHAHAGQLGDAVVQALEVLDVDGREHVDAGVEHVLDVLVALGVLDARRVRVRELVDQAQLGRALEDGGQVHLLEDAAAVLDAGGAGSPRGPRPAPRSPRGRGSRGCRSRRRARRPARPGPPGACGRSCRPRLPCRGRSCSGRGRAAPCAAHSRAWSGAEQVVDDEVDELDPDERRDQAAEPVDQEVAPQAAPWPRPAGSARLAGRAAPAAG